MLCENTQHGHYNKALTYSIFGVLAAMILYPPWYNNVAGMEFSQGYNFITAYRHTMGMLINADSIDFGPDSWSIASRVFKQTRETKMTTI